MRGKAGCTAADGNAEGITPAYAGKRRHTRMGQETGQDHPRVCGEKPSSCKVTSSVKGLPPRMRGKVYFARWLRQASQITPAYARKSHFRVFGLQADADHPRICGEKSGSFSSVTACGGSPPRMRGKAQQDFVGTLEGGITPAYAGKSEVSFFDAVHDGDHPRVCGEKTTKATTKMQYEGSPPRMRGKVRLSALHPVLCRITPAYAGKSSAQASIASRRWDHPRVCGEKDNTCPTVGTSVGITPAYAGKSLPSQKRAFSNGDHPRVCGEKLCSSSESPAYLGSPPRMRGKADTPSHCAIAQRITPAYAGKR